MSCIHEFYMCWQLRLSIISCLHSSWNLCIFSFFPPYSFQSLMPIHVLLLVSWMNKEYFLHPVSFALFLHQELWYFKIFMVYHRSLVFKFALICLISIQCLFFISILPLSHPLLSFSFSPICPVDWSCSIPAASLQRVPPLPECSGYDTKQFDGGVLVLLWEMWSTSSLSLLLGQFWPEVVEPDSIYGSNRTKLSLY